MSQEFLNGFHAITSMCLPISFFILLFIVLSIVSIIRKGFNNFKNSINKMVPKEDVEIHYVTRPYLTRHGSNNFLDMKVDGDIDKSKEINVYNEWQRDFMYQKLDLSQLQKRIKEEQAKMLEAKTGQLKSMQNMEEVYTQAIKAMRTYQGADDIYDEEE